MRIKRFYIDYTKRKLKYNKYKYLYDKVLSTKF